MSTKVRKDKLTTHIGKPVKRKRSAYPTLAERQSRQATQDESAAIVRAEMHEQAKAKRANMERLRAARLARDSEPS